MLLRKGAVAIVGSADAVAFLTAPRGQKEKPLATPARGAQGGDDIALTIDVCHAPTGDVPLRLETLKPVGVDFHALDQFRSNTQPPLLELVRQLIPVQAVDGRCAVPSGLPCCLRCKRPGRYEQPPARSTNQRTAEITHRPGATDPWYRSHKNTWTLKRPPIRTPPDRRRPISPFARDLALYETEFARHTQPPDRSDNLQRIDDLDMPLRRHNAPSEMAERVGFEPTDGINRRRFSRPVHSTALPPLRMGTR